MVVPNTTPVAHPFSGRAAKIYEQGFAGFDAFRERIARQAERISDQSLVGPIGHRVDTQRFMRVQELFEGKRIYSWILDECDRTLACDLNLLGTNGKLDADILALKYFARLSRAEVCRRLGLSFLNRRENNPFMALEFLERALLDYPADGKVLFTLHAAAAQCGISSTLARDFNGLVRAWRYISNSAALYFSAAMPEELKEDHFVTLLAFEKDGPKQMSARDGLIGELATVYHDCMTVLFARDLNVKEDTIKKGDVIIDTNILISLMRLERGDKVPQKHKKALDFCNLVMEGGGNFLLLLQAFMRSGKYPVT